MTGQTNAAEFGFPESNRYRALYAASKTRQLAAGSFEAVAALYFDGGRINQKRVVDASRSRAERLALRWIETGRSPATTA